MRIKIKDFLQICQPGRPSITANVKADSSAKFIANLASALTEIAASLDAAQRGRARMLEIRNAGPRCDHFPY